MRCSGSRTQRHRHCRTRGRLEGTPGRIRTGGQVAGGEQQAPRKAPASQLVAGLQSGMSIVPRLSGKLLVTGAAGFIGGNISRYIAEAQPDLELLLLDKLTRYSSMGPINALIDSGRARFVRLDLADATAVDSLINDE